MNLYACVVRKYLPFKALTTVKLPRSFDYCAIIQDFPHDSMFFTVIEAAHSEVDALLVLPLFVVSKIPIRQIAKRIPKAVVGVVPEFLEELKI